MVDPNGSINSKTTFLQTSLTSRGATKSLHDAAERGKVKDVIMFLSKMKRAAEVRERTRTTSQCEVRKQRKNALTN